jgi:hypothetical protein
MVVRTSGSADDVRDCVGVTLTATCGAGPAIHGLARCLLNQVAVALTTIVESPASSHVATDIWLAG